MNRKKTLAVLFVVSLVATMAVLYLVTASSRVRPAGPDDEAAVGRAAESESAAAAARREPRGATPRSEDEQDELEQRLVLMLRHLYGDRISSTSVQVLMAQVRIQAQTLFPMDWQSRFPRILEAAFPGFSAKILATLANVDAFDRWMAANEAMLAGLTPEEREKVLLAKKQELFGVAAVEELEAESRETQKREASMHDTIRALEESDDTTLDEKLDVYLDDLKKNFGDGPNAIALENSSALAHVFFGMQSVSRQLAALDPKARQEKINEIRRDLGFDEEEIAALEEDDREKEARWQTGYAYMNERRALEARYSGSELDQQLASLRQRYFGEESHTIELEEKDGFLRFERPRFYGRN